MFTEEATDPSYANVGIDYPAYMADDARRTQLLEDFGARLKSARLQRGKNQDDIGFVMGKTRNAVSQYESGRNYPAIESLIAFAEETGVSLDWLLMGREPTGAYEKRIHELPEGLKLYVLEALLLAERVSQSLPARFLAPPTPKTYVAFSEYLTKLSEETSSR